MNEDAPEYDGHSEDWKMTFDLMEGFAWEALKSLLRSGEPRGSIREFLQEVQTGVEKTREEFYSMERRQ